MRKKATNPYRRLDRAERAAIERGLDKRKSCRQMARELGRSPSTVADEVARNRTVSRGPGKGGRAAGRADGACPKLLSWPHCCNGCRFRRYHCGRPWRCEYSAARAQALADAELRESRMGVDRDEAEFEYIMGLIRSDVARGLSPEQIALAGAAEVEASPSTHTQVDRARLRRDEQPDLRRKCGYKPRSRQAAVDGARRGRAPHAVHGTARRGSRRRLQMDTVVGLKTDRQCLLTLYPRPFKLQLTLPMPEKTTEAVRERLDSLQKAAPAAYARLFGLLLTDNGSEFADCDGIERSALDASERRCSVYYCDVRQSQQKGRLRAQPRRSAKDTAQRARRQLRQADGPRLRRADVPLELRAQAGAGRHVRHRHAAGRLGDDGREPRRAGDREGPVRRAEHDAEAIEAACRERGEPLAP